jgi:hypothetical protein
MMQELDEHLESEQRVRETEDAQAQLQAQKYKLAPKSRPEKVDYFKQIRACLIRDYQQRWGDQW